MPDSTSHAYSSLVPSSRLPLLSQLFLLSHISNVLPINQLTPPPSPIELRFIQSASFVLPLGLSHSAWHQPLLFQLANDDSLDVEGEIDEERWNEQPANHISGTRVVNTIAPNFITRMVELGVRNPTQPPSRRLGLLEVRVSSTLATNKGNLVHRPKALWDFAMHL